MKRYNNKIRLEDLNIAYPLRTFEVRDENAMNTHEANALFSLGLDLACSVKMDAEFGLIFHKQTRKKDLY